MLDIKFIRENKDIIALAAKKKRVDFDVEKLIEADDKRKEILLKVEGKRTEQNAANLEIVKAEGPEKGHILERMKFLKEELGQEEEKLKEVMKEWQALMLSVPNIPDMSVPEGESDNENQELKKWGEIRQFDFDPKNHVEIMTALSMADFERGSKVHGFRGYYLTGDGVRLCFAIWNFALDFFGGKNFVPVIPPTIVRKQYLYGTAHLPGDAEDFYITQDGDVLAGTAEVPLMGMHEGEMLDPTELPKRYLGFSPCYRREAGAHGKDTSGLIRVHEFYKFEQLVLCEANHETSVNLHEELNRNTEEFIEALGIPYRTVINCGGDLGLGQVKKYDIELWVPKEEKYREISSASYFHDFQSRRLNIRYKDTDGRPKYVHSLNSTAIPTPRILVSLIENFQQADGSIKIPDVLVPYMNGKQVIN